MKKNLGFILCGVMCCTLLTGCGNEENNNGSKREESQQDIVMTCTANSRPENEYEATSTITEVYTYDNNMIL